MTWSRVKPRSQVHGSAHAKARQWYVERHQSSDHCVRERDPRARCPGGPLGPMGPHLHLDHHDQDKTRYLGFAHRGCNIRVAAAIGNARQKRRRGGPSQQDW